MSTKRLLQATTTAAALLTIAAIVAVQPSTPEAQAQSAPNPPVCDRTPQIRDAIVSEIPGVSSCAGVTAEQLAGIGGLDVQSSGITMLRGGDFNGLTGLTGLLLASNDLTSLPSGIFQELDALEWLGLGGNQLASLEPGIFDGLTRLESLNLSWNPLGELPDGIFDDLGSLSILGLFLIDLANLAPNQFQGLKSLETLSMGGNPLMSLPEGAFNGLDALVELELQDGELNTIPGDIFHGLTKLKRLRLGGNRLHSLPAGLLQGLVNLEEFDVSQLIDSNDQVPSHLYFYLEYVPGTSTEAKVTFPVGAPHDMLVGLSASDGSIQRDGREIQSVRIVKGAIESEPFQVTPNSGVDDVAVTLNTPDISSAMCGSESRQYVCYSGFELHDGQTVPNPHFWRRSSTIWTLLTNSEEFSFTDLSDITKQDLARITEFDNSPHCPGGSIARGDFNDFVNLRRLVVSHCGRLDLSADAFSSLPQLEELVLDYNALKSSDLKALEGLANLRHLSLAASRFDTLEDHAFRTLGALEFLDLSRSGITAISENTFAGLDSLRELRLHHNGLTTLPSGAFSDLENLSTLFLRRNDITSLPVDAFDGLHSLETLILDGNEISELEPDVFRGLTSLRGLDLCCNEFVMLPDGLLEGLTALEALNTSLQGPLTTETVVSEDVTSYTWVNIKIPVSLVRTQGSAPVARVNIPVGAPWDIEVRLRAVGGTITKNGVPIDSITIPTGYTTSPIFDIEPDDESTQIAVELNLVSRPETEGYSVPEGRWPHLLNHSGLDIVANPVSDITLPDTGGAAPTPRTIAILLLAGIVLATAATVTMRASAVTRSGP